MRLVIRIILFILLLMSTESYAAARHDRNSERRSVEMRALADNFRAQASAELALASRQEQKRARYARESRMSEAAEAEKLRDLFYAKAQEKFRLANEAEKTASKRLPL